MAPKRDPRAKAPIPTPAPSSFLGTIPKKKPVSAASAARDAGAPSSTRTAREVRGDKRQRNSSGSTAADPKKLRDGAKFDPLTEAVPLGHRHPPPSPTTSVSTVVSAVSDGGQVEDREVGDELEEIKACINQMEVKSLPLAIQVCAIWAYNNYIHGLLTS